MRAFLPLLFLFLALAPAVSPAARPSDCLAAWASNPNRYDGYYRPRLEDLESPEGPRVAVMSEAQSSVEEWDKIEAIKRDMIAGRFDYADARCVVGGSFDARTRTFYVGEGHHRFAAALEIAKETGNWSPFKKLVDYGLWSFKEGPPPIVHPMPVRGTLWNYFSWRSFLKQLRPHVGN